MSLAKTLLLAFRRSQAASNLTSRVRIDTENSVFRMTYPGIFSQRAESTATESVSTFEGFRMQLRVPGKEFSRIDTSSDDEPEDTQSQVDGCPFSDSAVRLSSTNTF